MTNPKETARLLKPVIRRYTDLISAVKTGRWKAIAGSSVRLAGMFITFGISEALVEVYGIGKNLLGFTQDAVGLSRSTEQLKAEREAVVNAKRLLETHPTSFSKTAACPVRAR